MTEDVTHIPRRLRRFYRKGQPIPSEYAATSFPETRFPSPTPTEEHEFSPFEKEPSSMEKEPWMLTPKPMTMPGQFPSAQPTTTPGEATPLPRREQRQQTKTTSHDSSPTPQPTHGLFSRVMEALKPHPRHVDKALGLEGKAAFEEKLPSASTSAIEQPQKGIELKQSEIEKTLEELRKLAAEKENQPTEEKKTQTPLTSFQFTPAGNAPNPIHPSATQQPVSSPLPTQNLSPRERMEMRQIQRGQPPAVSPGTTQTITPNQGSILFTPADQPVPGHIRRRMGRVVTPGEEIEKGEGFASPSEEKGLPPLGEDADFKSLVGDLNEKKKKKQKAKEEDEDFSLDKELGDEEGLDFGEEK